MRRMQTQVRPDSPEFKEAAAKMQDVVDRFQCLLLARYPTDQIVVQREILA